ncbi:phage tail protein [Vibrio quintilis]|uniref:T4-like virus tail tube protein gp19 n=1 Tax=Vibrio quintilis TaxID=1117707 RepID=A0A1M7YVG7_9VIBR|nr:phage tail protein [Vibrio quintilis]SHO56466.1 T4-like virus tail tube protein gp19 [Vibrio quintilis]
MSSSNDYPIVGYRFLVVIFSAGVPNPVDIRFQEVSGLRLERNITRQGNMTTLQAELPQQTLTLKRGVMNQISPLAMNQILEGEMWGTRMLRKDLLICVLDGNDTPVNSWLVMNAYLSSWSWEGIDANASDVLIESMEFKYTTVKYMPVPLG